MQHHFDSALEADRSRFELAKRASELLSVETEGTAVPTWANWKLPSTQLKLRDKLRFHGLVEPMVEVELRDELGGTLADVIRDSDVRHLHHRMIRIWGDMLELRSDEMLRRRVASLDREGVAVP